MSLLISKGLTLFDFSDTIRNSFTVDFRCLGFYYHCFVFDFIPAEKGALLQYPSVMQMKLQGLFQGTVTWKILLTNAFAFESSKKKDNCKHSGVCTVFLYIKSMPALLLWWTDKQRHEWSPINAPSQIHTHTIWLWRGHSSHHISTFSVMFFCTSVEQSTGFGRDGA